MAVMLATDELELWPAGDDDAHGWTAAGARPAWTGRGSLQLTPGLVDVGASVRGGSGPNNPAGAELGRVILPPDAPAVDGMGLEARGRRYVLSQVYNVADPAGAGLDVVVATVSEVSRWPA